MRRLVEILFLSICLFDSTLCQNCGSGQFACKSDNKCMDNSLYCNFVNDCGDASDEADCPATCDFSNDECGWYEGTPNDYFNWGRGRPSDTALTPNFAPRLDHTESTDQGYYAYINVSGAYGYPHHTAEYYSPVFKSAASKCKFRVWWYQDGIAAFTLEVWYWTNSTQDKMFSFYAKAGAQWNQLTIGIGRQTQNWQMKIYKKRYSSYNAATAIDDVAFLDCALPPPQGPCDSNQYRCMNIGSCIDKNMVCDGEDDCGDGYDERSEECDSYTLCNFEDDTCAWTQPTDTDQFNWRRASGASSVMNTGPPHDHTYANTSGYYMYIHASRAGYGRTAQLVSPVYQSTTSGKCTVRVFHYMYGEHIGKLSIYARIYNNSDQGRLLLWEQGGQKGMYWDRADAILNIDTDFQIVIEAMHGDSDRGNIAIDDVSFTPDCKISTQNTLPEAPPTTLPPVTLSPTPHPSCTRSEFFCSVDSRCIPIRSVCNFINDCSNGEDEVNCVQSFCNFEDGDCGWRGIYSESRRQRRADLPPFVWDKQQGKTKTDSEYRPSIDHTTNSGEGYYLFADNSPGEYLDKAQIISSVIGETGPNCHLEFYYHMTGVNAGTLEVLVSYGNVTDTRLSIVGSQRDEWIRGYVYLGVGQGYKIIFQAICGTSYHGDECLDDIAFVDCALPVLTGDPCTSTEFRCSNQYCIDNSKLCNFVDNCMDMSDEQHCDNLAGRCDFEIDMCGWINEKNDNFDWSFYSGASHKTATGPSIDHTTRTDQGGYMLIVARSNQDENYKARIASPTIKGTSSNCKFSMWYHMLGREVGSLNIYLRTSYLNNTESMQLVWKMTGEQGDYWSSFEYVVNSEGKDFKIVIEGQVTGGNYGDFAVDDVTFNAGCIEGGQLPGEDDSQSPVALPTCENNPLHYQCTSGQNCYEPWQRCNFISDCQDESDEKNCGNSCDFENGQCGWQNTVGDDMKWTWKHGPSWTTRTGPNVDHTFGNRTGHFMLIRTDSPSLHQGYRAHLVSLAYQQSNENCELVFWYYMYGFTVGSLSVHLKYGNSQSQRLWVKSDSQGASWQNATLSIGKRDQFWIIFEGTRGYNRYSDMAIDDIQFNNCGQVAGARTCDTSMEFECKDDKRCLSLDAVCDYKNDCGDASDEQNCTVKMFDCQFDDKNVESCQWKQLDDDNFDWRVDRSTPSTGTGPTFDHTTGSDGNSYFAYVDSLEQSNGDVASISTSTDSPFPVTTDVCTVRFWYHMYSSQVLGMGSLRVYTESSLQNKQRLLMWQIHGNQGNHWNYAQVTLSNPHQFKVVFEVVMGNPGLSDIAIDDVTFTPSCLHPDNRTSGCFREEFECPSDHFCIPQEWLNDGKIDCPLDCYDEDEHRNNCPNRTIGCRPDEFTCPSDDLCIPQAWLNDGKFDCPTDCYDEVEYRNNCPTSTEPNSKSNSRVGIIAGGVVGGVLLFVIILAIIIFAIRYHRKTGGFTFDNFGGNSDDKVRMSDIIDEPNVSKEPYSLDNPVYVNT